MDTYGEDAYDLVLEKAKLQTNDPFVGPGTYPDEDILEIVRVGCEELNIEVDDFLFKFGVYSFPQLAQRHPVFLENYSHPKDFLKTVEGVIHVEVRKLYDDTYLPTFRYTDPNEDELIITYYSKRKLYGFMSGLIEGVSNHFNVKIAQTRTIKEEKGKEVCDFHLKFS